MLHSRHFGWYQLNSTVVLSYLGKVYGQLQRVCYFGEDYVQLQQMYSYNSVHTEYILIYVVKFWLLYYSAAAGAV